MSTLRGDRAAELLSGIAGADAAQVQLALARATGQYRRGNERLARAHPRNRRD